MQRLLRHKRVILSWVEVSFSSCMQSQPQGQPSFLFFDSPNYYNTYRFQNTSHNQASSLILWWERWRPLLQWGACATTDEIHPDLPTSSNDQNTYVLGKIRAHKVVIASLPSGVYGTTAAATVANQMLFTFRSWWLVSAGVRLAKKPIFDWAMWWSANWQET
jgi:hypothetical protein